MNKIVQAMNTTKTSAKNQDAIARAAYLEWINAGKPSGRDQEFWFKGEAIVENGGPSQKHSGTRNPGTGARSASRATFKQ